MQRKLDNIQLIARPLWLLIILQVFIAIVFLGLPQGIDVLYAFIEEFDNGKFYDTSIKIITLFTSLAFWTIVSEYCASLILFLYDLSSEQLNDHDRRKRKKYIRCTPLLLFHFPILLTITGFVYAFFTKTYQIQWAENEHVNLVSLAIIIFMLILELIILRRLRYGVWRNKLLGKPLSWRAKRNLVRYDGLYNISNGNKMSFREYKPLFNLFVALFIISLLSILFWALAPVNLFEKTGSASFICMGFGAWTMMYTSIQFLSKRKVYGHAIPFKLITILTLLLVSFFNNDHPIRQIDAAIQYERPSLTQYFYTWHQDREMLLKQDSIIRPIIICAEGGALRTGCFSAMFLARIQERYPQFKDRIFCYSSVSGGSLGISFFNALCQKKINNNTYSNYTRKFFNYDFLAPVTGKLFFGEPINWFSPWNIDRFDRNIILEKSWESSWSELGPDQNMIWQKGFLNMYVTHKKVPALFINSTEVETGKRAIISNVLIEKNKFIGTVDFFEKTQKDIPYSTATGLSARFPLISSAGAVDTKCGRRHYLDGGYIENKGNRTAIEIIKALPQVYLGKKVEPVVLQISFSPSDTSCKKTISFLNEFNEIITALENTRSGRTNKANQELKLLLQYRNGQYIESSLEERSMRVPMNWTLSLNALMRIENFCSMEVVRLKNELDPILLSLSTRMKD